MDAIVEIISKNNIFPIDVSEINLPVKDILVSKLYYVSGQLSAEDIEKSIDMLFKDPVTEKHKIYPVKENKTESPVSPDRKFNSWEVEVFYKNEVTDPASSYILKALQDINIPAENVRTGSRYVIRGNLSLKEVRLLSRRYLANLTVQNIYIKDL